jgi:hypothetical protein
MPNCVSLCIQVDNMRGLIRALLLMESSDPSVFQLLDPFGQFEDPVAKGDVKVGHSPIILNVSIGGSLEYVFVVFDAIMESTDLFPEAANLAGLLGVTLGDGCEEPLCNGSEDVGIKVRMGHQGGCNGTG